MIATVLCAIGMDCKVEALVYPGRIKSLHSTRLIAKLSVCIKLKS
jgi:hypothetical protein